jgi:hypothetical protein
VDRVRHPPPPQHMKVSMKVMPPIFFSESIITIIVKFAYTMGSSFIKLRLFCHKVCFIINTFFPPLHEMLYASSVELFTEVSELTMHTVLQLIIVCKTVSLDGILQEVKKTEVGGC